MSGSSEDTTAGPSTQADGSAPLVTIIVPTYNRRELVQETIDSVLAQDHPRVELLVLDDGSTDGTAEVLERYAREHPKRFRWDRHENMGQARTLNRGFEMMRGDYVGYLSSDDVLAPSAVRKLAAALDEDPEAVVAYPAFTVIDEAGEVVTTITPPEYETAEALRLHNCIVNAGAIYRRSVIDRIGGWDPSFVYVADLDFFLRASALGPFRLVREPLASWRAHPGSANAAPGLRGAAEQTRLLDKFYSQPDLAPELLEVREEAYRNAYFVAAHAMGGVNRPGERFFVHDTLARETSSRAPELDAQVIARLRRRVANLEAREARTAAPLGQRSVGPLERLLGDRVPPPRDAAPSVSRERRSERPSDRIAA
jgi:glycosyltransferase involved in cell wall biosynthesis